MMKWFKRGALALAVVISLAIAVLYLWSSLLIGKKYPAELRTVEVSDDPLVIQNGERLAQVFGCYRGCHGKDMEGKVFFEEFLLGRFVAPNLTRAFDRYSTAELEAIVRQGVRPGGRSLLGMPSDGFSAMTDEDLSAIFSFVHAYPKQGNEVGAMQVGPLARLGLVMGEFYVAAAKTLPQPWEEGFRDDPLKLGEYLATNACSECHGLDFEGQDGFTPPLTIIKAYSMDGFSTLMATGQGLAGRDLGLMSTVAQSRFSQLNRAEVEALYAYFSSR
jgi:cytochrome c553